MNAEEAMERIYTILYKFSNATFYSPQHAANMKRQVIEDIMNVSNEYFELTPPPPMEE